MTRNIINPREVDAFLQDFLDDDLVPEIGVWLTTVARRWVLRAFEPVCQIFAIVPSKEDPDDYLACYFTPDGGTCAVCVQRQPWIDPYNPRAYQAFEGLGPEADELEHDLLLAAEYLRSLLPASQNRINRVTVPAAIEAGKALAARRAQQLIDEQTLEVFDDGYRIVLLEKEADLAEEGRGMNHCVASYAGPLRKGQIDLLSLRDPNGKPHVTLELQGGKVVQVRGKANAKVAPHYRRHVQDFLESWDIPVVQEREMLGLTTRSFEAHDPTGWRAESRLPGELLHACRANTGRSYLVEDFENDLTTAVDELDDETWAWVLSLFQDEEGRFARFLVTERFEVAGELFTVRELVRPWIIAVSAGISRQAKRREVMREINAELEGALLRFLQSDQHSLLVARNLPWDASIDLTGLRWAHLARVRRRLASARKQARRITQNQETPSWLSEKWKLDWKDFADRAHRLEQDFC